MWFNPSEIVKIESAPVATLATLATFESKSHPECPKVAEVAEVATCQDSKIVEQITIKLLSIQDRQREARRQKVLAMLETTSPETKRIVYVDTDNDHVNAILAVAIRDIATFEMTIPKANYDAWQMLELLERMGTDISN